MRSDETSCPFCGATLARVGADPLITVPRGGRAAILGFAGAMALSACGGAPSPPASVISLYGGPSQVPTREEWVHLLDIGFAPGSAELDDAARSAIEGVYQRLLAEHYVSFVRLTGYGGAEATERLGMQRANAVAEQLVSHGVPRDMIEVREGEEGEAAPEHVAVDMMLLVH